MIITYANNKSSSFHSTGVVKVRGSTNGISNKYSINSFITQLETTHKEGSNQIINCSHDYISYLIRIMLILVNVVRYS